MRSILLQSRAHAPRVLPALLLGCAMALVPACGEDSTTEPPAPVVIVEITSPADRSSHVEGDDVTFTGTATDPDGNAMSGDDLVWTSNQDAWLGTGESCTADLSEGTHTVTLTSNHDGVRGTDSIELTVIEGVVATITSPTDGATLVEGEEITFSGTGTDPFGTPLTGASLVWRALGDGDPMGEGETFTDYLPVGDYTITLTATDDAGRQGDDSVEITVDPAVSALITSPVATGTYDELTPVLLSGSAQEHDGTPLTGDALVWRSSRVGELGNGESFSVILPEGEQTISLTATNDQGRYARVTVLITVTGDGVMYNHTGNYTFTSAAAWVNGSYFTLPDPMTGFCTIDQVGATMALTFTDGYLDCAPVWICAFTGSGRDMLYYDLSNSGHIGDLPDDYLTNALTVQSYSETMLDIEQLSVYENVRGGVQSSTMSFRMTLQKIVPGR